MKVDAKWLPKDELKKRSINGDRGALALIRSCLAAILMRQRLFLSYRASLYSTGWQTLVFCLNTFIRKKPLHKKRTISAYRTGSSEDLAFSRRCYRRFCPIYYCLYIHGHLLQPIYLVFSCGKENRLKDGNISNKIKTSG